MFVWCFFMIVKAGLKKCGSAVKLFLLNLWRLIRARKKHKINDS